MNDFLTWEILKTYASFVTIVFMVVEFTKEIKIINKRNEFKYGKLTQEFLHEWYKKQPINRDIVEIAKILKNNGYNLFVLSNMANQTYEYFKDEEIDEDNDF